MSRIDEELAQAVRDTEPEESAVTVPASLDDPADAPLKPKRNLGLLAALLVMGGGILALVFTSFEDAAIYSKGVDELVRERSRLASRNVRVEGTLVKGTLTRRDQPCEYRFRIQKNGAEIPVHYAQCVVPDTFRDVPGMDVAVTAEGKLNEAGHFDASHIMAKCPSKYEMKERQAKGEKAPHASVMPAPSGPETKN
jgi:cytochrome c-type biogenesis protein CcmE